MALKTPSIYHLALHGKGLSTPGFDDSVNPQLWGKREGPLSKRKPVPDTERRETPVVTQEYLMQRP